MKTKEIIEAKKIIEYIEELRETDAWYVNVSCGIDWSFGFEIQPHRKEMLLALKMAKASSCAIMKQASEQQIKALQLKLKEMGVEE